MIKEIKVLDKGYVRLVNYMGGDSAIANAARISYDKGTRPISDDEKLIRYLMKHRHTSPFEMVEFQFELKMPLFVIQQLLRHRTANINQMSLRYSEALEEFYIPEVSHINKQSKDNKQGRGELLENSEEMADVFFESSMSSLAEYQHLLNNDVARELSRMVLPANLYSKLVWKMDLHNLFHFLKLRMDPHAQYEIQEYARAIYDIIKPIVPISCSAAEDYLFKAESLSRMEIKATKFIVDFAKLYGLNMTDEKAANFGLTGREWKEFKEKVGL